MKAYYKTNAPEVLDVLKIHTDECEVIKQAGLQFAEHFGGAMMVNNSVHGYRIAGLRFSPKKDVRLWIHPDDHGMQRPRQSIVKATPEEKAALAALRTEWRNHFPTGESDFSPVMKVMGTSWGNCAFNGGFKMFEHEGFVYVACGPKLAPCMVEIMGSEFGAAEIAHNEKKQTAKVVA